jgi:hypothetical protein
MSFKEAHVLPVLSGSAGIDFRVFPSVATGTEGAVPGPSENNGYRRAVIAGLWRQMP